MSLMSLSTIFP